MYIYDVQLNNDCSSGLTHYKIPTLSTYRLGAEAGNSCCYVFVSRSPTDPTDNEYFTWASPYLFGYVGRQQIFGRNDIITPVILGKTLSMLIDAIVMECHSNQGSDAIQLVSCHHLRTLDRQPSSDVTIPQPIALSGVSTTDTGIERRRTRLLNLNVFARMAQPLLI